MIGHGVGPASDGVTSGLTTFGAAGVMKLPHAVAMHAIQVLPALAWLLSFAALPERQRLALVWAATTGYAVLVAVSLGRTTAGLAPLDLGVATAVLSLLGVVRRESDCDAQPHHFGRGHAGAGPARGGHPRRFSSTAGGPWPTTTT
jgi:hypothetical protein